jgi:hypothetical protein
LCGELLPGDAADQSLITLDQVVTAPWAIHDMRVGAMPRSQPGASPREGGGPHRLG